jgi:pimeloyl-ACP methyl ester carboxylesterase
MLRSGVRMPRYMGVQITEQHGIVAGLETRWAEAPRPPGAEPAVYVHGVPNTGPMWRAFIERTGGLAPDLPGFGESAKPNDFAYSIDGYSRWLSAFLADRGIERYSLVAHDWGALSLALAQAEPERVSRAVLIDAVPLLPGYEWHRLAALWRRQLIGELGMGLTTKFVARRLLAEGSNDPYPDADFQELWSHFDHGTQRAILKLYRSAPPGVLEAAGAQLARMTCPALVVWGSEDPYVPASFAQQYADALGGPATVRIIEGAGHWPWLNEPSVIDDVAEFLAG